MNSISLSKRRAAAGFTLIEVLIVLGIMGIFMIVSYPSIMNTMAVRNLDNTTRQVQTFLQQTKLQAVDTKIVHRVRFFQPEGTFWAYDMERLQADGTWIKAQGNVPRKTIPSNFNVTVTFPAVGAGPRSHLLPPGDVPGIRHQPEFHHAPEPEAQPPQRDGREGPEHLYGRFDPVCQAKECLR